jgi:tripartite-type tricarboxylate transporter receptor subunit TctC
VAGSAAGASGAARPYPEKPVRIVTSEPSSGNDLTSRILAHELTMSVGQNFIVDNRGIMAGEIAAKSPPDGYTLVCYGSPLWLAPFLRSSVAYDPVKDLTPIILATTSPNVLVVHPSIPVKSIHELVAASKARPGEFNYASGSAGSSSHLAAELFKSMAQVEIVRVAYRGTGPALNALLAAQVHVMFSIAASAIPFMQTGKLRGLAVTSPKRSALAPGLPTVAESGLPGYEATSIQGIFAAGGTAASVVNLLNSEMKRALQKPEIKARLFNSGVETVGSTPEELGVTVKIEMDKLGKLIVEKGIRND